jgi:hypothetical protein
MRNGGTHFGDLPSVYERDLEIPVICARTLDEKGAAPAAFFSRTQQQFGGI